MKHRAAKLSLAAGLGLGSLIVATPGAQASETGPPKPAVHHKYDQKKEFDFFKLFVLLKFKGHHMVDDHGTCDCDKGDDHGHGKGDHDKGHDHGDDKGDDHGHGKGDHDKGDDHGHGKGDHDKGGDDHGKGGDDHGKGGDDHGKGDDCDHGDP